MQSLKNDDLLTSINSINLVDTVSHDDHMILHVPHGFHLRVIIAMQESAMETVQAYMQQTELATEMQEWEDKIRPILAEEVSTCAVSSPPNVPHFMSAV